jgi:hypothetical protein
MTDDILEELGLPARRPGRPKGSRNKNRVATADRINAEGDPIGFLCKVVRGGKIKAAAIDGATSRTWCYPTIDQRKDAAVTLAKKVMPDLRPSDVEIAVNGHQIIVTTGIARLPTDPPIDITPSKPALSANLEPQLTEESVTGSDTPVALPAGRPWHPSVSPSLAETGPSEPPSISPGRFDPKSDEAIDRERSADAKIAELNSRAAKFVA